MTTLLDFRVREEMAGALLKEVAALEPAERLQEAPSLAHTIDQAVGGLEELWQDFCQRMQAGVMPSDAAALARILTRSANLMNSSLELLVRETPSLEEFKQRCAVRLQAIKAHAASLRRLVEIPSPAPDPESLRRSLEQMERDEGVDAEDFLAELQG